MKSWQEDLLSAVDTAPHAEDVFRGVVGAAVALGFEHCAYGLQLPYPVTTPRVVMHSNYPEAWRQRYRTMNYLAQDPTVALGRRGQKPIVWRPEIFAGAPLLWDEARQFGLVHGWAQSNLHLNGMGGMLTLTRSAEPLTGEELQAKEGRLRWLVSVAHMALARVLTPKMEGTPRHALTDREREVLKWSADGKTCSEISDILAVSEHTVNFHMKNAVCKLGSPNKTSAVVRAVMLGLLA